MVSVIAPAAVGPPMMLLLTVGLTPVVPLMRIPRNPTTVPVPPELMVMEPMLLLLRLVLPKLKS